MEDDTGGVGGLRRKTSDHLPRGIKAICRRNDAAAVVKRKKHRSRGPDADMNWYFYHSTGGGQSEQANRNKKS